VGLLLRTPVAIAVATICAIVALVEILGYADWFSPALVAWALCLVLALRSAIRRCRGAAIAYVVGALPATIALAFLVWFTAT
jgi:hypothetical protein